MASRFFLDKNTADKLINKIVYVVPPALEEKRKYIIEKAKYISSNQIEISLKDFSYDENYITGKCLLLSKKDAIDVFGKASMKDEDKYVGKIIIDKSIGKVGQIVDVAGTSAQKHFIVEYNNSEVLIPLNEDLIESETENEIYMNLPIGLLDINEA